MKITLWENLLNPVGRDYGLSWAELVRKLTTRADYRGAKEHPGWSPAEFRGHKREEGTVERVWALCLDYDKGDTIEAATGRFEGLRAIVHTSRKHTPDHPRFRVVLQLSRPVSPFEFKALWRHVSRQAGEVDPSPKDPSRFWFLPGCSPEAEFIGFEVDGSPLNVDEWLARPEPVERVVGSSAPLIVAPASVEERAVAYIAKMPEAISGAHGHDATWNVALVLAKGFSLSAERTLEILRSEYNSRCQPPWSERELRHKANQAKQAKVPEGFLLNDDRPWTPARQTWKNPPPDPDPEYVPEPPEWLGSDDAHEKSESVPLREPGDDSDEQPQESRLEKLGVATLRETCLLVWEEAKRGEREPGFTTGMLELDAALGGLRRGHVTLLAAGTSWGKSTFGIMVVDENIKRHVGTMVVSVEDPKDMYARRIIARRGGLNSIALRDNDLDHNDIDRLAQIAGRAEDVPFFMNAVGVPVETVAKNILVMIREFGIRLVVCDYVQRFKAKASQQDRRNHVTYVAETLSDAIKRGEAAGLILSQLKRIDGREPTMDDVKESGDLENMAEHVLLGHKYETQSGIKREVKIAKNKDGPVLSDAIALNFNEVSASFVEDNRTYAASDPDPPKNIGEPIEDWASEYDQ